MRQLRNISYVKLLSALVASGHGHDIEFMLAEFREFYLDLDISGHSKQYILCHQDQFSKETTEHIFQDMYKILIPHIKNVPSKFFKTETMIGGASN